ncbi:hypothetical protein FPV67DRAFT_1472019 [Lyophyllum atratum]|nr:hypothetical protein FPV67DRAFT_1472019 [Lyophyllum atratum]
MPSQSRPYSPTLGILVLIVIISLFLVFAPDMHGQASVRHQRRRFEVAPRQLESASSSGASSITHEIATSTTSSSISIPPSSSSSASLSSSSVTSGPSSSSKPISSPSAFPSASSSSSSSSSSRSSTSSLPSPSTTTTRSSLSTTPTPTPTPAPTISRSASTAAFDPTPRTTLVIAPPSSTATALQTLIPSPSATSGASSASHKGFWANKTAVAGTFTVVGILGVGVIVVLLVLMRRRSDNRRHRDHEFYQTFAVQPEMAQSAAGSFITPSAGGHIGSPAPSVAELSTRTPMDPYVGNLRSNFGSSYTTHSLAPVQERGYDASHPTTAPPVSSRQVVDRNSYQPSIDSFYGGR